MTLPAGPCYALCMSPVVAALRRYPVKGLGAEPLERVTLIAGRALPSDRRWALAHRASTFNPASPAWLPKSAFVQYYNTPALAGIATRHDPDTTMLHLQAPDGTSAQGRLDRPADRVALAAFLLPYAGPTARGSLQIVEAVDGAGGHIAFTDARQPMVSILGLESVRELERAAGATVDAGRFRANLWVDGLPAWHEFDWEGHALGMGEAQLRVVAPITRCTAIEAGPSGTRDLPLLTALNREFRHQDCGVYAEVVQGGDISVGDLVVRV
jgi:uncharacterized protein